MLFIAVSTRDSKYIAYVDSSSIILRVLITSKHHIIPWADECS